jgi:hypothetical protein
MSGLDKIMTNSIFPHQILAFIFISVKFCNEENSGLLPNKITLFSIFRNSRYTLMKVKSLYRRVE